MNLIETVEYNVSGSFLPAIINGDESTLSDSDQEALREFISDLETLKPKEARTRIESVNAEEEGHWARCEVCMLFAMCHTLKVSYFE